ncbi:hypothetical protein, partial [Klebsiella pneumoniae]
AGARSAGANTGWGFYSGLAGTAGSIYSLAASIASNVASTLRSALSIHSPSRVTRGIGSYTGEGFYLGMGDWLGKVKQMSKDYADAVVNRNFESNALMVATGKVVDSGVINQLDDMQRQIDSA